MLRSSRFDSRTSVSYNPGVNKRLNRRRDRYDVSGNIEAEYVDAQGTVLVNRLNLVDREQLQLVEEDALVQAYERLISEVRVDTPLTNELIRKVHAAIFDRIYAWAGRWRTVTISKPGITWPPPDFLAQSMEDFETEVLRKFPPQTLIGEDDFCRAVAQIQGEFLVVHPFREGNARTIKLLTDLLAVQTGRPLLAYDRTVAGRDQYILAAGEAFRKNYLPLVQLIRAALASARRP
jgi:cell filamentation protein